MAKFARRKTYKGRGRAAVAAAAAAATLTSAGLTAIPLLPAVFLVNGSAAHADTTGGTTSGSGILSVFLGQNGLPGTTADDLNDTVFGFLRNEYMGVVMGIDGGFGNDQGADTTREVAGRITFGNTGGNLRGSADNNQGLVGLGFPENTFATSGVGQWPLPSSWVEDFGYDFPAYIKANIDGDLLGTGGGGTGGGGNGGPGGPGGGNGGDTEGTTLNVGFSRDDYIVEPNFVDNSLQSEVRLLGEDPIFEDGGAVTLKQNIQLRRNTARLEWRLSNYDTVPHRVYLRFTINHRGNIPVFEPRSGFSFTDPATGVVNPTSPIIYGVNTDNLPQVTVPAQINILGARYQDPNSNARPFYSARLIFRGPSDATVPSTVFVGDPDDLQPEDDNFLPPLVAQRERFTDGIATAVYFGPFNLQPTRLDQQTIVLYYGNGSSSDTFSASQTLGLEAEEALQFNSSAALPANRPAFNGSNYADVARAFLSPSQLTIFGSLYNHSVDTAQSSVQFRNVSMTLSLPRGLRFGTNTATGQADTATKAPGNNGTINADTDGIARWAVEPTGEVYGAAVYQLSSVVGEPGPEARSVSRSLTIPATPLYPVTSRGFQTIGVPFQFDESLSNGADVRTVLNTLSDQGGQPREEFPVLFGWDARRQAYIPNVQTLETARGYFYRPAEDRILFAAGVQPAADQAPADLTPSEPLQAQTLEAGWNLISNPFLYDIPLSSLSFISAVAGENVNRQPVPFIQAVAAGVLRGSAWFFDPNLGTEGDYDFLSNSTDTLRPWVGYWIYLNDRRTLRFTAPNQVQSAILPDATGGSPATRGQKQKLNRVTKAKGAIGSGRAIPQAQTLEDWRLQIVAKHRSGRTDAATLLGVSPGAKDGDDSRDLPKPPAVMGDTVQVGLVRAGGATSGGPSRYAQDLKSPGGGVKTWGVEVSSEQGGPVSLSWPNIAKLPKRLRLTLKDEQTGRSVSVRNNSSFVVNVPAGGRSRFTVTASRELSRPLALSNFKSERAPTRSTDGTRPYNFGFTLTADAQVSLRILDVRGRQVDVVAAGRSATGGSETRLYWRGRSQDNRALPVGSYMVEVTARSESSGDVVVEKRPLMILQ